MPHTIRTTRAHPGKKRFSRAGDFEVTRMGALCTLPQHPTTGARDP